jgi:hypothetical protein
MKDRTGNKIEQGNKLLIVLPEALIYGFVAEVREPGTITGLRRGGTERTQGFIHVSCVLSLPVDPESGRVMQCTKVYDPDKHDGDGPKLIQPN